MSAEEPFKNSEDQEPTPVRSAPPLLAGRWNVIRELGRGGMGAVYLAYDTNLGKEVAIKKLLPGKLSDDGVQRMRKEVCTAQRLTHENLARIHDLHVEDNEHFITMEYVEGKSLRVLLKEPRPLQVSEALGIVRQVARGLDHLHANGVIHRDVKPENIILRTTDQPQASDKTNQGMRVKIVDFGLAMDETAGHGPGAGTRGYMAPEQIHGNKYDRRADIFALGVVPFELLTGKKPYETGSPRSSNDRPYDGVGIVGKTKEILARALAWDPNDRWEAAGEFVDALEQSYRGTRPFKELFRINALVDAHSENANLVIDVGFLRGPLKGLGKPTEPIICGCAIARVTLRLAGGTSTEDPSFRMVPDNAQAKVEFGIGTKPSVRFEAECQPFMLDGRGRMDFPIVRTEKEQLRVAISVDPERLSVIGIPPGPANSATRILVDVYLTKIMRMMTKRFTF